jgi:hypothetical protein
MARRYILRSTPFNLCFLSSLSMLIYLLTFAIIDCGLLFSLKTVLKLKEVVESFNLGGIVCFLGWEEVAFNIKGAILLSF